MPAPDAERYRSNLREELDSVILYRTLATVESNPQIADVYERIADTEERHAAFWRERLQEVGESTDVKASWRAHVLSWLGRRFGPAFVLPVVQRGERSGGLDYSDQPEVSDIGFAADEHSHARLLEAIADTSGSGGVEGGVLARLEGRHRATSGNALRAAVLGANDGLVSNLSLVMGVAGAALSAQSILVTGLAGLLAGAGSMAMGEWLSVQSSRELYQRQITTEAEELAAVPDEEQAELALIYQAKGLSEAQAEQLAERLVEDTETALDTLAREELGIDPEELGGSSTEAAATSFVLFSIGAIVPVLPFFFFTGSGAILASVALSGIALFAIGAGITLLTGRSVLYSGTRQVLIGLAAAALTYGVGTLIGGAVVG